VVLSKMHKARQPQQVGQRSLLSQGTQQHLVAHMIGSATQDKTSRHHLHVCHHARCTTHVPQHGPLPHHQVPVKSHCYASTPPNDTSHTS
jgi:hypothetical protein